MIGVIFDLILVIANLVIAGICGYKFITGDMNENKTLYYGILALMFMLFTK